MDGDYRKTDPVLNVEVQDALGFLYKDQSAMLTRIEGGRFGMAYFTVDGETDCQLVQSILRTRKRKIDAGPI